MLISLVYGLAEEEKKKGKLKPKIEDIFISFYILFRTVENKINCTMNNDKVTKGERFRAVFLLAFFVYKVKICWVKFYHFFSYLQ